MTTSAWPERGPPSLGESGSEHEAVRIVLELDKMLHDANTLLNGVTLLSRERTRERLGPPPRGA